MDKSDDSSVIAEKVLLDVMRSIGFKKTLDFLLTVVLSEWHKNLTLALLFSVMRWVIRNFQGSDHICIFPLSEKTSKLIWAGGGSPRERAVSRADRWIQAVPIHFLAKISARCPPCTTCFICLQH
jgi:hypothetical protein